MHLQISKWKDGIYILHRASTFTLHTFLMVLYLFSHPTCHAFHKIPTDTSSSLTSLSSPSLLLSTASNSSCHPRFEQRKYTVHLSSESLRASPRHPIARVKSSGCPPSRIIYSILTPSPSNFWLHPSSGSLYYLPSTVSSSTSQRLRVVASDALHPHHTDTATVLVNHKQHKKNIQRIPMSGKKGSGFGHIRVKRDWTYPPVKVLENQTMADSQPQEIAQVYSSGSTVTIEYRLYGSGASEPPIGLFAIDSEQGNIYLNGVLDREKITQWNLTVRALNVNGGADVESPLDLLVTVIDINDNPPVFEDGPYYFLVKERQLPPIQFGRMTATDADDPNVGGNAQVRYSIAQNAQNHDTDLFTIESVSGNLSTTVEFDREEKQLYTITVRAGDMYGNLGGFATLADATIEIADINDHAPVFKERFYTKRVKENWVVGTSVIDVKATDKDVGKNAECTYGITLGNVEDYFFMDTVPDGSPEGKGSIKLKRELDYETGLRSFNMTLVARNEADGREDLPQFDPVGYSHLYIEVEDVNEPPVFDPPRYEVQVPEDIQEFTPVVSVSAHDYDQKPGWNQITFFISRATKMSDPNGWFDVDEAGGSVSTVAKLDRENPYVEGDNYYLTVLAKDMPTDVPSETGSATVTVKLIDVNDNYPRLGADFKENVCTETDVGVLVLRINATDLDDHSMGHGPPFSWKIDPTQNSMNEFFDIKPYSQTEADILTLKEKYEDDKNYTLDIQICDAQNLCSDPGVNTVILVPCKCENGQCGVVAKPIILGITDHALIAIVASIVVILLIAILLIVYTRRRRKDPEVNPPFYDDDIRETFISYDDEGGGEEDQDSYDISQLRKPADSSPHVSGGRVGERPPHWNTDIPIDYVPRERQAPRMQPPHLTGDNPDVGEFINERLADADDDPDNVADDTVFPYCFEGGGSSAGSLSSLASGTSEGDQSYDYLKDWGPRFKKLADMYGSRGRDDDEDDDGEED